VGCGANLHADDGGRTRLLKRHSVVVYLPRIGAMVGIYFKTKRLPVRFLIYIAITALTRLLTVDIKGMLDSQILTRCGATLILAIGVFVLENKSCRETRDESHD